MDNLAFDTISTRLLGLEVHLNAGDSHPNAIESSTSHDAPDTSVISQISGVQTHLDKLYSTSPELVLLNKIITENDLWKKLDQTDSPTPSESNPPPKSTASKEQLSINAPDGEESNEQQNELSTEAKQQLLLLKYPQIKQAYNNLAELANMDLDKIVNYLDSSQDKTHDFKQDESRILARRKVLDETTKQFHMLVVKNMIVYEKYIDLLLRQNQFWIDVDEKITGLERSTKQKEILHKQYNKY